MARPRPNREGKRPLSEAITEAAKSQYGAVASGGLPTDHGCVKEVAEAFGDMPEELASIPGGANMGRS